MLKKICAAFVMVLFCGTIMPAVYANNRSFDETVPMALTGAFTGTLFGLNQYGQSHQTDPKQLALGAVYGLASGALLGAGIDLLEITSRNDISAGKITQSIILGGVSGAMFGSFIAFIPYAITSEPSIRNADDNFYHASIGAGLGGIIGGSIWLMITLLTDPLVVENKSMNIKVGMMPEEHYLNLSPDEQPMLFSYRCVQIMF